MINLRAALPSIVALALLTSASHAQQAFSSPEDAAAALAAAVKSGTNSAGTRSDDGRDSRDALLGLAKTCDKLGSPFWDYLGGRLNVTGHAAIDALDQFIRRQTRYA